MEDSGAFFPNTRIPEEFFGRVIKDNDFRAALLDQELGADGVRELLERHHIYISDEGLEELEQLRSSVPDEVRSQLEEMGHTVAS